MSNVVALYFSIFGSNFILKTLNLEKKVFDCFKNFNCSQIDPKLKIEIEKIQNLKINKSIALTSVLSPINLRCLMKEKESFKNIEK